MFLMLVISSVSTPRTRSDMSSSASVESWNTGAVSTMTTSWVIAERSTMRRMCSVVTSSAISGLGGARSTRMPVLWLMSALSTCSGSPPALAQHVHDGLVAWVEVEQHAHVAELEAGVHERDRATLVGRDGDREVDRERGPADPALGREEGDDPARPRAPPGARRHSSAGAAPTTIRPIFSRSREYTRRMAPHSSSAAEGLDQELAGAREHRAPQVVRLALDAHHHDRGRGHRATDSSSVVAMPSMPGMLMSMSTTSGVQPGGDLDGLRPGRGHAHDLDVGLEREQLGEVFPRLEDVVDDDDPDRVSHLAPSSCSG